MGHSEMLLAVAGMKHDDVRLRAKKLSTADWSDFPPAERAAFGLAYRLSREPDQLTDKDRAMLTEVFGANRTVDLVWYTAWCNYMTRVADAFQLPLERNNVFESPAKK
jgi:hypothetical protein